MRTSPSEATRSSSTLDERIARDCERSGVPFHVEDDALLDRVAELTELAWAGNDDGGPGSSPGRRLTSPPLPTKEGRSPSCHGPVTTTGGSPSACGACSTTWPRGCRHSRRHS